MDPVLQKIHGRFHHQMANCAIKTLIQHPEAKDIYIFGSKVRNDLNRDQHPPSSDIDIALPPNLSPDSIIRFFRHHGTFSVEEASNDSKLYGDTLFVTNIYLTYAGGPNIHEILGRNLELHVQLVKLDVFVLNRLDFRCNSICQSLDGQVMRTIANQHLIKVLDDIHNRVTVIHEASLFDDDKVFDEIHARKLFDVRIMKLPLSYTILNLRLERNETSGRVMMPCCNRPWFPHMSDTIEAEGTDVFMVCGDCAERHRVL